MHDQWQPRGIVNFRDVGGAVGSKAGPKPGQLFRSSGLDNATKEDRRKLHADLGITTVINLDGPPLHFTASTGGSEAYAKAYKDDMHTYQVLDITVHEIRLLSEAYGKNLAKQLPWQTNAKGLWYMFTEQPQVHRKNVVKEYNRIVKGRNTWLDFLAFSKTQIKSVFEQLAREDLGPVLICGNGTGFIVCLLLKLLYVADEDVKREYLLTQRNWEALCEEHNERRRMEGFDDLSAPEFPVKATDQTIEYLDAQYNGIEGYLASIGLMDGEIRRVRANMRGSGGMSQKVLIDVDESSL